jgi:hypothetical protein
MKTDIPMPSHKIFLRVAAERKEFMMVVEDKDDEKKRSFARGLIKERLLGVRSPRPSSVGRGGC